MSFKQTELEDHEAVIRALMYANFKPITVKQQKDGVMQGIKVYTGEDIKKVIEKAMGDYLLNEAKRRYIREAKDGDKGK